LLLKRRVVHSHQEIPYHLEEWDWLESDLLIILFFLYKAKENLGE